MSEKAKLSKDSHNDFAKSNMRDSAPDLNSILLAGIGAGYSECAQTVSDYWSEVEHTTFIDDTPEDAVSVFDLIRLVGDPREVSVEQILTQAQEEKRKFVAWQKSERPLEVVRFFYRTRGNKQEIKIDHVGSQDWNFILTLQVAPDENGCFEIRHANEKPEDEFPVYRFLVKNCLAQPFARTVVLRENLKFKINAFAYHDKIVVKISCGFEIAWQNLLEKMSPAILDQLSKMAKGKHAKVPDGQSTTKLPLPSSLPFPTNAGHSYAAVGARNDLFEWESNGNGANLFASFAAGKSNYPPVMAVFFLLISIAVILVGLLAPRNTDADIQARTARSKSVSEKPINAEKNLKTNKSNVQPLAEHNMSGESQVIRTDVSQQTSRQNKKGKKHSREIIGRHPLSPQGAPQNERAGTVNQTYSEPVFNVAEAIVPSLSPAMFNLCKDIVDKVRNIQEKAVGLNREIDEVCSDKQISTRANYHGEVGYLFPFLPKTELPKNETLER